MQKLVLFVFLVSGATTLQADIIYNNFGTTPPFDPSNGLAVVAGGTDLRTAIAFTVSTASYVVTEIDFAAQLVNGASNLISATLYSDAAGGPGNTIFTTGLLPDLDSGGTATDIQLLISGGPILQQGVTYWLGLDGDTSSTVRWNYNGQELNGQAAFFDGDTETWSPSSRELGAFEISGDVAAPEPMTFVLLVPGFAALMIVRRRQQLTK